MAAVSISARTQSLLILDNHHIPARLGHRNYHRSEIPMGKKQPELSNSVWIIFIFMYFCASFQDPDLFNSLKVLLLVKTTQTSEMLNTVRTSH